MQSMTARERVGNLLQRKPVDRSAFHASFLYFRDRGLELARY